MVEFSLWLHWDEVLLNSYFEWMIRYKFEKKFFFEVKFSLYFNIVRWNFGVRIKVSKEGEFLARNRIEDVNIEDLEYETESESESESEIEEDSSTDSENGSFNSFESDDESEVSSDDIEI